MHLTINPVPDAELNRVQLIEYIQLGYAQARCTVVQYGPFQGDRIEPSAAPRAARCRSKFVADPRQMPARIVEQLGRKRPAANARGIGLDDSKNIIDTARTDSGTGCGTARGRIRRGDIRIRPMIDIK